MRRVEDVLRDGRQFTPVKTLILIKTLISNSIHNTEDTRT